MRSLCPALALAVVAVTAPVAAQEPASRAEELAAKQRQKAAAAAPYTPNRIEQQLLAFEQAGGFGAARGVFPTFGGIKAGSGPAFGAGYGRTLRDGTVWYAKGVYSVRNFKLAQVGVESPALAGGRLRLNGRVRWQDAPVLRVYELGPTSPDVRADFAETMTEVAGDARFTPARFVRLGAAAGYEAFRTGPGASDRPPIETVLGDLPGLYADPTYLHSSASAAIDSRAAEGYSRSGSYLGATVHDYRQQDEDLYSFRRLDLTAEQFVPVLNGNWVLYFNARASLTDTSGGQVVPFFLMPALGGGRSLRAYSSNRFRDRHSMVFTGEYRWYAQEFVDVALFFDAGKVAPSTRDLNFEDLTTDGGIGIRFHGPATTVLRMDLGYGREGFHLVFGFSGAIR